MLKIDLSKVENLPKDSSDPVFEQRETGLTHTPYRMELLLLDCIKRGDLESLSKITRSINLFIIGRMSKNDTRQMQFAAVSCITLATRSAIEGGMDEMYAFNLSDCYIQKIDELNKPDAILSFLTDKIAELTNAVYEIKERAKFSKHTRLCLKYISKNLHKKINLSILASECGLSCDYLSYLFKKETGENLYAYILRQKLLAAKSLIETRRDNKNIGLFFSFCSESHFISSFKKEFGVTPLQYVNSLQ